MVAWVFKGKMAPTKAKIQYKFSKAINGN